MQSTANQPRTSISCLVFPWSERKRMTVPFPWNREVAIHFLRGESLAWNRAVALLPWKQLPRNAGHFRGSSTLTLPRNFHGSSTVTSVEVVHMSNSVRQNVFCTSSTEVMEAIETSTEVERNKVASLPWKYFHGSGPPIRELTASKEPLMSCTSIRLPYHFHGTNF